MSLKSKQLLPLLAIFVICLFAGYVSAKDGEIKIRLGKKIERSYEKVKADNFAYGPKQDVNPETQETQIYLPYGNNPKLYYECKGIITDPEPGKVAQIYNPKGQSQNDVVLTYKLVFNKPITYFRIRLGWVELALSAEGVAGAEYSTNGKKWQNLVQVEGPDKGIKEPFITGQEASGLNTKVLYIRIFSRLKKESKNNNASRWFKLRMTGNPDWGDAHVTFFKNQALIRVKGK